MSIVMMLGRIFVGWLFVFIGIRNFLTWDKNLSHLKSFHWLPVPAIVLGVGVSLEILCGLAVIFGYWVQLAASYLIVFTVVVTYFFHNFWSTEGEERMHHLIAATVNLAVIGGLLLAMRMS